MAYKKPSSMQLRALCGEVHPEEDGIDPRDLRKGSSRKQASRKSRQLCSQVAETLSYALAGQCDDDVLRGLYVVSVEPEPNVSRLLVTVGVLPTETNVDPGDVLGRLDRASARLRCAVAAAITRKRAPVLAYRFAIPTGGGPSID